MSSRRNRKGYLLLEVVASIAVIAIGLAVILRSFTSSLRASKIAQEYFKASLLVQDKIAGLEIEEELAGGVAASESSTQISGTPYSLETKITKISDGDTLNQVITIISWTNKERNEKIEIGTYLKGQAGVE
ncbi:MAG: type II secretion system protein [Candidatus Omnitrophica bacterium]|nr:type II secretion system protein [Candidatus Omnitrophota bacterium]MDD5310331.1 type II secretion system protein [Candidatus Omnitrophota bacterium]MDD5545876.1 type II secretion system protein [Candidatus Omnitrophota bacterium]